MTNELKNTKVAILATDGFEEVELSQPLAALEEASALTKIVAPKDDSITAWDQDHWSDEYAVDDQLENATSEDYDALLLPGGVLNPDQLRTIEKAVQFAADFLQGGKPVAAICHGSQTLIETGELEGRTMTSYHSVKTDLINAGANWVNQEVVVDDNLISSRNPDDIPSFNEKIIEEFAKANS